MEDKTNQPENENVLKPFSKEEHLDKQVKETEHWVAMEKEILKDLKTNPRYKPYFEKYHPGSIDHFINNYATHKTWWFRFGPMYKKNIEKRATEHKDEAYELMWEIQQKKLFNLQCEWRAEKLTLPGVEICKDFMYWEHNIRKCTFIPPITEEEIELYRQYLLSTDYSKIGWLEDWQNYEDYKKDYTGDGEAMSMPEWYMFYDSRKGTGTLLTLPDIRGQKEEKYLQISYRQSREKFEKDKKEHPEKYPEPDPRPFLKTYPHIESLDEFVRTYEDKKTYGLFIACETEMHKDDKVDFDLDSIWYDLQDIEEKVPVKANADWRYALYDAYQNYLQHKIAGALPAAYDEYCLRMNTGIAQSDEEDSADDTYSRFRENDKKRIIEGRIALGEPGDLNF